MNFIIKYRFKKQYCSIKYIFSWISFVYVRIKIYKKLKRVWKKTFNKRKKLIDEMFFAKFDRHRKIKSKNKFRFQRKKIYDNSNDDENFDLMNFAIFSIKQWYCMSCRIWLISTKCSSLMFRRFILFFANSKKKLINRDAIFRDQTTKT